MDVLLHFITCEVVTLSAFPVSNHIIADQLTLRFVDVAQNSMHKF
jgi:hypothetical protein